MNGNLLVAVVPVQQQTGSTECGVMAIVNAYHAMCGDDLAIVTFSEELDMRKHLSLCSEKNRFSRFPLSLHAGFHLEKWARGGKIVLIMHLRKGVHRQDYTPA